VEKLATLQPAFKSDGVIHAGELFADQRRRRGHPPCERGGSEGASAHPRARIVATAVAGTDPTIMLTGPIPATKKVLKKSACHLGEIDLFEVNEAFASVPLAWARDVEADLGKTNVRGGRDRHRSPLGASGARIFTTLLHIVCRAVPLLLVFEQCKSVVKIRAPEAPSG